MTRRQALLSRKTPLFQPLTFPRKKQVWTLAKGQRCRGDRITPLVVSMMLMTRTRGWSGANQNNAVKGIYKTNVFGQNEERTYSVTCADNFGNKDSASVTISSSSDEIETPSVDFWSDPDIVVFGDMANLLWLSENTKTGQCLVMSSDDDSFSGKGKSVEDNGSTVTEFLVKS